MTSGRSGHFFFMNIIMIELNSESAREVLKFDFNHNYINILKCKSVLWLKKVKNNHKLSAISL